MAGKVRLADWAPQESVRAAGLEASDKRYRPNRFERQHWDRLADFEADVADYEAENVIECRAVIA